MADNAAVPVKTGNAGRRTYIPEVFEPKGLRNVKEFRVLHRDRVITRFDYCFLVSLAMHIGYCLAAEQFLSKLLALHFALLLIRSYFIQRKVKEESLLVSRDWGVQVTTNYYLWGPRRTFVHKDDLSAIIINEGFYSWKVIYYLAIMVKGQEKLVLPFEYTLPMLQELLPVYNQANEIMFGDTEEVDEDTEKESEGVEVGEKEKEMESSDEEDEESEVTESHLRQRRSKGEEAED